MFITTLIFGQSKMSHTMWRFVVTWCEMVSRDVVSSDEVDVTKSVMTWRHYVMIRNNGIKDISTKWLSDLKSGFCKTQFYMNKERFSIGQLKGLIIGQFSNLFWLVDFRKLKKKQCCWSDINQGRLINISYPSGSLPVGNIYFRSKPERLIQPEKDLMVIRVRSGLNMEIRKRFWVKLDYFLCIVWWEQCLQVRLP